jgi:hypothetical protein
MGAQPLTRWFKDSSARNMTNPILPPLVIFLCLSARRTPIKRLIYWSSCITIKNSPIQRPAYMKVLPKLHQAQSGAVCRRLRWTGFAQRGCQISRLSKRSSVNRGEWRSRPILLEVFEPLRFTLRAVIYFSGSARAGAHTSISWQRKCHSAITAHKQTITSQAFMGEGFDASVGCVLAAAVGAGIRPEEIVFLKVGHVCNVPLIKVDVDPVGDVLDDPPPFGGSASDDDDPPPFGGSASDDDDPPPFGGSSSDDDDPPPFGGSASDDTHHLLGDLPVTTTTHHLLGDLPVATTTHHLLGDLPVATTTHHLLGDLPVTTTTHHLLGDLPVATTTHHLLGDLPLDLPVSRLSKRSWLKRGEWRSRPILLEVFEPLRFTLRAVIYFSGSARAAAHSCISWQRKCHSAITAHKQTTDRSFSCWGVEMRGCLGRPWPTRRPSYGSVPRTGCSGPHLLPPLQPASSWGRALTRAWNLEYKGFLMSVKRARV